MFPPLVADLYVVVSPANQSQENIRPHKRQFATASITFVAHIGLKQMFILSFNTQHHIRLSVTYNNVQISNSL